MPWRFTADINNPVNQLTSKITRRHFLTALGAGLGGTVATGAYGSLCEAEWLATVRHQVKLGDTPRAVPLRVLHLSDFHASEVVSLNFLRSAFETGLALKPDLICLTGDFITTTYDQFAGYAEALSHLAKAAPTFASLGNHDGGFWSRRRGYATTREVRELLARADITLLGNRWEIVTLAGTRLRLVGVGDWWAGEMQPELAYLGAPSSDTTILLSHNPDTKNALRDYPWDLMLSGHTHGGQLWVPLVGAPFAPVVDKRFVHGLHRWERRWIHVTRGVGNLHGIRLNCRPEVSLLTLV